MPGRLTARPTAGVEAGAAQPGLIRLGLDAARDALLYVPSTYQPGHAAPLVLTLHGAGGDAQGGLYPLHPLADDAGMLLLSPPSRGDTWDVIRGGFGPDVTFLDRALAWTFQRYAVDPIRFAVAGFSDGASYALSLGIGNGDLFSKVLAFSPGFMAPPVQVGRPRIFISHGIDDAVLPIDGCSRRIVPRLRSAGYDVMYKEFPGPHAAPLEIARAAVDWLRTTAG